MGIKNRIKELKHDYSKRWPLYFVLRKPIGCLLSDKQFVKLLYYLNFGRKCDLKNPSTFNEKIQYLKLYNRKQVYTIMADKYLCKEYVGNLIGSKYVVPLVAVFNSTSEINIEELPSKFVIKTTHGCGGMIIQKGNGSIDYSSRFKELEKSLRSNYYNIGREWPYKNIKPRIIVEELLEDPSRDQIIVYKFFCFNGVPFIVQVIQDDKKETETIDYFDMEWNLLDLKQNFPNSENHLSKPYSFDEMKDIAARLSIGFPFLRVDLYEVNRRIYFSEFTFFSDNGTKRFEPECWDSILGEKIDLSLIKKE